MNFFTGIGIIHDEVKNSFLQALDIDFEWVEHDCYTSLDKGHGQIERRTVYVTGILDW